MLAAYLAHQLPVMVFPQRELHAAQLQTLVSPKIEDEVVKQLVRRLRHRSFRYQCSHRVYRDSRISDKRIRIHGILRRRFFSEHPVAVKHAMISADMKPG